jgi:hypothetical protein
MYPQNRDVFVISSISFFSDLKREICIVKTRAFCVNVFSVSFDKFYLSSFSDDLMEYVAVLIY